MQADIPGSSTPSQTPPAPIPRKVPGPKPLPADKLWRLGFEDVQKEFIAPVPVQVHGRIPAELNISLFRNGPGCFSQEDHWVDGQGFLVKLNLHDRRADYQSRFIETAEHLAELAAAKRKGRKGIERLYGRYGSPLPHGLWTLLCGRPFKNVANTSVVHHAGRLMALGEGGGPEVIDPQTLASLGTDRMNVLGRRDTFSAHPKTDPATGALWNFGITYDMDARGMRARLRVYSCAPDGITTTRCDTVLPFPGAMHDFCITGTRAVFVLSPSRFPGFPVDWFIGQNTLGRLLKWQPELGTRIGVLDLKTGAMRWHTTHPMVTQHTVNAWDEGDDVVFDVCDDDGPERWLRWYDVLKGDVYPRRLPRLRRFRVNAERGVEALYHPVAEMEFPGVDPSVFGRRHSYVFGLTWDEREPFFGTPCKVDSRTGQKQFAKMRPGEYAGEPILVSKRGQRHEGDVWMLTMVMCTREMKSGGLILPAGRSELQIFDGSRLDRGPVARCVLPQVVPYGFHGQAVDNSLLQAATAH